MDLADDVRFAQELAEKVGEHRIGIGLESLERGNLYDTGIWIFDDMGANTGPLFSPRAFEKVYFPVYKKMISSFKKAGTKKVILHSDGNILPFLDMLIEAGIDGINPVEHKAGMNVLKLKEKYGKKLSYLGGIDNAIILPQGNKKEIENHVRPILEAGREGGIAVGTHSVGDDISVETYDYYHYLVQKYGNYEARNS
jgi:uroporphyrinogen decarboxylase